MRVAGVEVQQGTVNMLVTYVGIPIWTQASPAGGWRRGLHLWLQRSC